MLCEPEADDEYGNHAYASATMTDSAVYFAGWLATQGADDPVGHADLMGLFAPPPGMGSFRFVTVTAEFPSGSSTRGSVIEGPRRDANPRWGRLTANVLCVSGSGAVAGSVVV